MVRRAAHAPTRVTLAHLQATGLLGQHEYERQLIAALAQQPSVRVRERSIGPMRGPAGGTRIPMGLMGRMPALAQELLSPLAYGAPRLVHRMDARLPAARREVLTLHDVAPLRFDDEGEWPMHATTSARRALVVVTPSRFAADEVESRLGVTRTCVIANGVDAACWTAGPLDAADRAAMPWLPERYVLYAGGSSRRKNLAALSEAWSKLGTDPAGAPLLLICGPDSPAKQTLFAGRADCRLLGAVERGLLLRLMSGAAAVVVPSVYEGFGLPVLEAMATGTVAIASRGSSLTEVASDIGLLAEPTAGGLAAAVRTALEGDHRRRIEAGRQWAAGFRWSLAAEQHAELYRELTAR